MVFRNNWNLIAWHRGFLSSGTSVIFQHYILPYITRHTFSLALGNYFKSHEHAVFSHMSRAMLIVLSWPEIPFLPFLLVCFHNFCFLLKTQGLFFLSIFFIYHSSAAWAAQMVLVLSSWQFWGVVVRCFVEYPSLGFVWCFYRDYTRIISLFGLGKKNTQKKHHSHHIMSKFILSSSVKHLQPVHVMILTFLLTYLVPFSSFDYELWGYILLTP